MCPASGGRGHVPGGEGCDDNNSNDDDDGDDDDGDDDGDDVHVFSTFF